MNDNREKLIEKIRNIMARTTDNGCTEAEAMSAARLAKKLMDESGLTVDDLVAGQTTASASHWTRDTHDHPIAYVAKAVGMFTGTKLYCDNKVDRHVERDLFGAAKTTETRHRHLRIIGLAHEIEIAGYILDICYNAMQTASAKALQEENLERSAHREPILVGGERKTWVYDFQRGMAHRMSETLKEMCPEIPVDHRLPSDGRSLVAVRTDLIKKWFDDEGITLRSSSGSSIRSRSGFEAGKAAGGRVNFHSGVGTGQRGVAQIGSR